MGWGSRTLDRLRDVVPPAHTPSGAGLTTCPAATLIAALMSALQVKPQLEQTNSAWLLREFLSIHPQALQRRLV